MDDAHKWLKPYTHSQLIEEFLKESGSINKHLLTLFSLVVGLNAQRVVDIGAGSTTRAIKAGLEITQGELFSCDINKEKYKHLLNDQHEKRYHFSACNSKEFIKSLRGPFDFVLHDGAHDYKQVLWDLDNLLPLVRQYGIICVHDTQNSLCGDEMLRALQDAFYGSSVTWTHLPYCYGLTIIRVEGEQPYAPLETPWVNKKHAQNGIVTKNQSCGLICPEGKVNDKKNNILTKKLSRSKGHLLWLRNKIYRRFVSK